MLTRSPLESNGETPLLTITHNVTATWVFADNWINYLEASGEKIDVEGIRTGYRIMKVLLKQSLTDKAYLSIPDAENLPVPFLDET